VKGTGTTDLRTGTGAKAIVGPDGKGVKPGSERSGGIRGFRRISIGGEKKKKKNSLKKRGNQTSPMCASNEKKEFPTVGVGVGCI